MKTVGPYGGRALGGLALAMGLTALPTDRLTAQERPPAPTALRPVRFPAFQEATLPNGLSLVVIEHHEQPVFSLSVSFPAGSAHDARGKEGLADLVAEVLTKGTRSRSAEQIAATIEGVGGRLGATADLDFLTVTSDGLSDQLELALELVADVVRNATFPDAEVELARTRLLSALQVELSQPEGLGDRAFARELYGDHPYGRRPTTESYRATTLEDVRRFAMQRLRPRGALVVVAGDVTLPRVRALLDRHFAGWSGTAPAAAAATPVPVKSATDIVLVHRPGSVQAYVAVGNTTFSPAEPGFYAARLATQVLGGGPDSRLFLILRERKSWTYGAFASLQRYRGLGFWRATASTRTEVTDSALTELLRQIDRIRTEAIPDSELVNAKGFLVGSFPLSIETPRQIASQVAQAKLLGLGTDYVRLYRDRLNAVTAAQAQAAAARVYRRRALTLVLVGDAEQLHDRLTAIAPVRLLDADGRPFALEDLRPKAGALEFDRAQLVARADSFRVLVQGNPFGSVVKELRQAGDSLVYTETTTIGPALSQRSTAVLDAATLAMRRTDQTGTAQGQQTEIHLVYAGGRVTGRSQTPQATGTPKVIEVDTAVESGTVDDNVVDLLVPALLLAEGKTFTLSVFSSAEGTVKTMAVKVAGADSVTVPAGAFATHRLEVSGGQVPIVMHVSRATPRRVVKIEFVGPPLVFELVK